MKVYALKYKTEYLKFSDREFDVSSDYRWERDEIKDQLTVSYGTFTEEGTLEMLKTEKKEEVNV